MLIIVGGLPGTGKTTIARELSRRIAAMHLHIDSIEQAIRDSGTLRCPLTDEGYRAAYAVALDKLAIGGNVVADCVNPLAITRDAWREVANRANVPAFEVEVVCSDVEEHRRRVETRSAAVQGLRLPTWQEVLNREYEPYPRPRLVIDTAQQTVTQGVWTVLTALPAGLL